MGYLHHWYTIPLILLFTIVIGALSGSYPAFYLSSFNPARIFKSKNNGEAGNHALRSTLVVIQFAVTIILLISTFIIASQIRYIRNKSLGYNKENILVIDNTGDLGSRSEAFRIEIMKIPGVKDASRSWTVPGKDFVTSSYQLEGDSSNRLYSFEIIQGDYDFINTLGIQIKEGRTLSQEYGNDEFSILINEAAVRMLGLTDPVGYRLLTPSGLNGEMEYDEIVGIFKDINYKSLHFKIEPMLIGLSTDPSNRYTIVNIQPGRIMEATEAIQKTWKAVIPAQPMEFFFLDENLNNLYQSEIKAGKIFTIFSALAVFVACLGLLGLSAFTAEKRRREIGIRKAHGASTQIIIRLLSKEIVVLITISSAIAWPIVYYIMKNWLQHFAYQTGMNPLIFLLSSGIGLIIAIGVVIYQSYNAASMNPAEALKCE